MISLGWLAALLIVAVMAAVVWFAGRRSESQLSATRQEMQAALAAQGQALTLQVSHQIGQLGQSVTQQLGQVRQELQTGVAASGQLASNAQREVAQRLQSSTETLMQMSQQIGAMQRASQDLSQSAQTLQSVLGGAKTRGMLGEAALERLLEDALPRDAYAMQYRFPSTGAVVDAIVRGGERILPVDSKFPRDAYRRMAEEQETARRDFSLAVRKHADSIAEKYILPAEHTFDYALMFVPSEGVYYELLMTEDPKYGRLDEYCRRKHVFPVSPNTLYACLGAIAISLQGQKIEENAKQLFAALGGLKRQIESTSDVFDRLGKHLHNAEQSYGEADKTLNRARATLEQMSQGALPEAEAKSLGAVPGE